MVEVIKKQMKSFFTDRLTVVSTAHESLLLMRKTYTCMVNYVFADMNIHIQWLCF